MKSREGAEEPSLDVKKCLSSGKLLGPAVATTWCHSRLMNLRRTTKVESSDGTNMLSSAERYLSLSRGDGVDVPSPDRDSRGCRTDKGAIDVVDSDEVAAQGEL